MLPKAQNAAANAFAALIELNLQNGEAGVEREFFQAVETALNCLVLKTKTDGSDPDEKTSVFSPATSFVAIRDSDGPRETFSFLDNARCNCKNKNNTDFGLILWNYKGVSRTRVRLQNYSDSVLVEVRSAQAKDFPHCAATYFRCGGLLSYTLVTQGELPLGAVLLIVQ